MKRLRIYRRYLDDRKIPTFITGHDKNRNRFPIFRIWLRWGMNESFVKRHLTIYENIS